MLANLAMLEGESACGFEGPEKRLEVNFKMNDNYPLGLRSIKKDQWQEMCNLARCTIISHSKNDSFDAFVLSESSLFVYPFKVMIKTCGTTTLLECIPKLLEFAEGLELELETVIFSRKNFLFPQAQRAPHSDWKVEVEYLNSWFDGTAYILGPLTQEHWYLYVADYTDENGSLTHQNETTLEIMMHNLNADCAAKFYKKEGQAVNEKFPGVVELIPDQETDEFNFNPCGYSMNGLHLDNYMTIHVTPELHCSYASVETNILLPSYSKFISQSLALFKPGTITLAFTKKKSINATSRNPFDLEISGYLLKHKTFMEVDGNSEVTLCNYESVEFSTSKAKNAVRRQVKTSSAAANSVRAEAPSV